MLFNCAHGVADDDGGVLLVFIHTLGQIQIAGDVHLILVFEGDLLYGHGVAFDKIFGAVGHIGQRKRRLLRWSIKRVTKR